MSSEPLELTSSELAVLESLRDSREGVSQRELARRAGLSLGLVNAVIKRLVHTGYVKTSHLNRRSIEYLLTPEGFAQTALRSYRYIVSTVRSYQDIRERLMSLGMRLRTEGYADFFIHGDGELAELVALFFEAEGLGKVTRGLPPAERKDGGAVILNAHHKPLKARELPVIELLQEFRGEPADEPKGAGRKVSADSTAADVMREFYKVEK
jgi:DNA-binding MarR family transcriptional regulator